MIETRHVKAALKAMTVKTDRNDARGMAQLMRMGWFRPVHVKAAMVQEIRALLTARKLLVTKLRDVESSLRGILRGFGLRWARSARAGRGTSVRLLVEQIQLVIGAGVGGSVFGIAKHLIKRDSLEGGEAEIELNTPDRKVLAVEDPIEYQLDGINQVQIKPQIGLSFASVLRSMLRHDPDVIMVGEIRDLETAQIAIQAALTGHVVLSTVHTNNAASTLTRLLDMGVEDYLMTSTLNAIVAQRLVRRLCQDCRKPLAPVPELLAQLGLQGGDEIRFWHPVGCPKCNDTGYFGRISINEVLVMSDPIRRQILHHAEATELQRAALAAGMRPMFQDGIAKAAAGVTSVEEVLRVTREVD